MENSKNPDLELFKIKYDSIITNYKKLIENLANLSSDIKKLENVHNTYINNEDLSSLNFSIYVDDIKHQINLTKMEYKYISDVLYINLNKLYRDLFKLYTKVVRNIIDIFKENKDVVIKIWNSNDNSHSESADFKKIKKSIKTIADATRSSNSITYDNKIFEEIKKKFFSNIKIYNEMGQNEYDLATIQMIYNELIKRLEDLFFSQELIKFNLDDIKFKADKGILTQTFMMDLNGKIDRIKIDYNIFTKIFESILNIHNTISERHTTITTIIANYVSYDEDSLEESPGVNKSTSTINKLFTRMLSQENKNTE
jgi:hypothetical protein